MPAALSYITGNLALPEIAKFPTCNVVSGSQRCRWDEHRGLAAKATMRRSPLARAAE
jgi:hypothetical protein